MSAFDWKSPFFAWCREYRFLRGILYGDQAQFLGEKYLQFLQKWNESQSLVGPGEIEKFWERHWLDSLKAIFFIRSDHIVDFGSGGGFPSFPIAIFLSNLRLTCVERVLKKRTFLTELSHELQISDRVKVVESLQEVVDNSKSKAIEVTMRGVSPEDFFGEVTKLKAGNLREIELVYWGLFEKDYSGFPMKSFKLKETYSKEAPFELTIARMFHVEHS